MEILIVLLGGVAIFIFLILVGKFANWIYEKFFSAKYGPDRTGNVVLIEMAIVILFSIFLEYAIKTKTEYILKPNNELIERNELIVFNKKILEEDKILHYKKETTTSSR